MHTAEFVHDIAGFNRPKPKAASGKTFRRCFSPKSPHILLWNKVIPKIDSWNYISKNGKGKCHLNQDGLEL